MKMLKNTRIVYLGLIYLFLACNTPPSRNYYFDALNGDNSNSGTSVDYPFKSLDRLADLQIEPGDTIFLSNNKEFDKPLEISNVSGSEKNPIVITNYPNHSSKRARIHTKGKLNAVLVKNSSFIEISNLDVSAISIAEESSRQGEMRCGVLVTTDEPGEYQHIYLSNLVVHDVFFQEKGFSRPKGEVKTANGTQAYGWGIRLINNTANARLKNIKIEKSIVRNVAHTGIKLTSRLKDNTYGIFDFVIDGNVVEKTGGPGIQMSGVFNGHILNNKVDQSGSNDDTRKWGRGSGLWTWGSSNVLIEHNTFSNANGPGDSAGAHIDFNCKNIVLQYNLSRHNAGGFCEILGNNYNCAYRYNISINDGYRIKGENGAFQEGKTFWLSGYNGNKPQSGPFNSYFYNNTIYVGKDIVPKIAIHKKAKGVLIANNIFHFENDASVVKGDQYNPAKESDWEVEHVVFHNNLFTQKSSWPSIIPIYDTLASFGNPDFSNQLGIKIKDFVPLNKALIKNRGTQVEKLPNDSIGLIYGLAVKHDILGNPIINTPDIGAIEID